MRDPHLATAVRDWAETVPAEIRADLLWRMEAYRLGLYVCDMGWDDVTVLSEDVRTRSLADQLTSIIRLLLVMTRGQRSVDLREPTVEYSAQADDDHLPESAGPSA